MGVSHSSEVRSACSFLSQTMFSTVVQIKQDCQSTGTLVQNQNIKVGTSDDVIKSCLAGGWSPKDCAALKSTNLSVYNVNQTGKVVLITKCQMDSTIINQLQSSLTDQINQQLSKTTDGVTGAVKDLIQSTQATKDSTVTSTDVKNFVSSTFKLDAVQTAINKVVATQDQAITVSNADQSTVHDVTQAAQVEATLEVLQANKACAAAITKMDNQVTQAVSTVDRGVADIASTIGGVFNNLFATLGNWIYVVGGVIGLLILCCLCCCLATLFSGKSKDATDAVTTLAALQASSAAAAAPAAPGPSFRNYLPTAAQVAALAKAFKR